MHHRTIVPTQQKEEGYQNQPFIGKVVTSSIVAIQRNGRSVVLVAAPKCCSEWVAQIPIKVIPRKASISFYSHANLNDYTIRSFRQKKYICV
jgi:hypothetical protein